MLHDRPILLELRWAEELVSWTSRFGGPRRGRSPMAAPGDIDEVAPEDEQRAIALLGMVAAITDRRQRRAVALAMKGYSLREIAAALAIRPTTAGVAVNAGLDAIEGEIENISEAA